VKESIFVIASNRALTADIYEMVLEGDTSSITAPGQFVNIKLDGFFLRRPISVCAFEEGKLTIIYKILGKGTRKMTELLPGVKLNILTGLGNGYDTSVSGQRPLLIGGGVGIPPMYQLCRILRQQGKSPVVLLGFNKADDLFYVDEFKASGAEVIIATADGSVGTKGFVTDALPADPYDSFYVCGPTAMLQAVDKAVPQGVPGQFSFEEHMGCGFGACMGCTCKTKYGNKRICKDGPVLVREEIIW
jgi:dihydroorotate dehydrogenase electron transfer subunit